MYIQWFNIKNNESCSFNEYRTAKQLMCMFWSNGYADGLFVDEHFIKIGGKMYIKYFWTEATTVTHSKLSNMIQKMASSCYIKCSCVEKNGLDNFILDGSHNEQRASTHYTFYGIGLLFSLINFYYTTTS